MTTSYIKKHSLRSAIIKEKVNDKLGLVIVIPAYNEKSILKPLQALSACSKPLSAVEVIVVFNASETDDSSVRATNEAAMTEAETYYNQLNRPPYKLHLINENELPKKHAGVGLARKIGMDEAVRRLGQANNTKAPIICFDADSCCAPNYLCSIEEHFKTYATTPACSIHFEHPLNGEEFNEEIYSGIALYELHLRYYKNGLGFANLPYAYHTIGSSMAVRATDYCKQGGMNKGKAGEDFYFLQKFIKIGTFSELKTTKVIPSPRVSDRVPFGTGRALMEMIEQDRDLKTSYAWSSFLVLKEAVQNVHSWYMGEIRTHAYFKEFVGEEQLRAKVDEIRSQSTTQKLFIKRFFYWFDAFRCLKFMHFLRDNYFPNEGMLNSVPKLLIELGETTIEKTYVAYLNQLRAIDRHPFN